MPFKNKEKLKEYLEKNRDKRNTQSKQYRLDHLEEYKQKYKKYREERELPRAKHIYLWKVAWLQGMKKALRVAPTRNSRVLVLWVKLMLSNILTRLTIVLKAVRFHCQTTHTVGLVQEQ